MKISALLLSLSVLVSAQAFAQQFDPYSDRHLVTVDSRLVPPGTIVIARNEHHLYFGLRNNQALRYDVALPKDQKDKVWFGQNWVKDAVYKPAWLAPDLVAKDHPELAGRVIPSGAPNNPMGEFAFPLYGEVAIHGTTSVMRKSIGSNASYGCVRMRNEDVLDLAQIAQKGDRVCMGHTLSSAMAECTVDAFPREASPSQSANFF